MIPLRWKSLNAVSYLGKIFRFSSHFASLIYFSWLAFVRHTKRLTFDLEEKKSFAFYLGMLFERFRVYFISIQTSCKIGESNSFREKRNSSKRKYDADTNEEKKHTHIYQQLRELDGNLCIVHQISILRFTCQIGNINSAEMLC